MRNRLIRIREFGPEALAAALGLSPQFVVGYTTVPSKEERRAANGEIASYAERPTLVMYTEENKAHAAHALPAPVPVSVLGTLIGTWLESSDPVGDDPSDAQTVARKGFELVHDSSGTTLSPIWAIFDREQAAPGTARRNDVARKKKPKQKKRQKQKRGR